MEIKTKFKLNDCLVYDTTDLNGFPTIAKLYVKEITIVESDNRKGYSIYYSDGKNNKEEAKLRFLYDNNY